MISIIIDPTLEYPDAGDFYSPDEDFPEYPFSHLAKKRNPVYKAVRQCLAHSGLDHEHYGAPSWNPLGPFIKPGDRVFVLCNFANERRRNESIRNFQSRCTHGSVIRAVIDYILIAIGNDGTVSFGNAPTQYCHWNQVLEDTGAIHLLDFYRGNGIPVQACDLRLFVTDANYLGAVRSVERRDEAQGIHVNLGKESLLSLLDDHPVHRYRIMNYNPDRIDSFHSNGRHEYVINRTILESDVIFSIPKFKTHEKVGISCALKGFVGTVGHKDSLPHHRYGTPQMGGDEYPHDRWGILRVASSLHERIQHTIPDAFSGSTLRAGYRILKRIIRPFAPVIEGAWWGNDTAWRMVLDLARIAMYASKDGIMQERPCREHLALIDGILGGEGEGPAYPTAVKTGLLQFGDNLPVIDLFNVLFMGFTPSNIPLVREAQTISRYPLLKRTLEEEQIFLNSRSVSKQELHEIQSFHFQPSDGWKEKI